MTFIIIRGMALTVATAKIWRERLGMAVTTVEKRTFDASFKLKVIDCASQYSNNATARVHGIDEKRVLDWRNKRKIWRSFQQTSSGWMEQVGKYSSTLLTR